MLDDKPRFITSPSRGRNKYPLQAIKADIRNRSGHNCDYCGGDGREVEHINPVSGAGINDPRNLIIACKNCNQQKGAKPVTQFLREHPDIDTKVADLPIYGDLIVDTQALPATYRKVRKETIINFRREGGFSGREALKDFERQFRRNLWQTDLGYWLCLRYPAYPAVGNGTPGQRRVAIPLIEQLVVNTGSPIYEFLYELTKNATLRQLIDDMVYYHYQDGETVPASIRRTIDSCEDTLKNEVAEIQATHGITSFEEAAYSIPSHFRESPVQARDLLVVDINDFRAAGGSLYGVHDGFKIKVREGETGSDVPIRITAVTADYAEAVPLQTEDSPAVEYDEAQVRNVIRDHG